MFYSLIKRFKSRLLGAAPEILGAPDVMKNSSCFANPSGYIRSNSASWESAPPLVRLRAKPFDFDFA
jgi:hypothetical protein